MSDIKAIETEYNGYRFRSRLEARWAILFDELGIKYEYEPEGFQLSDGSRYLPDFYLIEQHDFFEVKGVMTDLNLKKLKQFVLDSWHEIFIGYSDFSFEVLSPYYYEGEIHFAQAKSECYLGKCVSCNKFYFFDAWGSWACRNCDYYDGDSTFTDIQTGNWREGGCFNKSKNIMSAIQKAKYARFEHGEKP